ncbi:MAG: TIGR03013 family PEP-CTERM/XrtA system glycosyltransferase [Pseudomonadota bacterium]|nr:TIGR03013 family PEP-CTERM/XrtA system glycosyltransferase [Pseudomonadota bacterium]
MRIKVFGHHLHLPLLLLILLEFLAFGGAALVAVTVRLGADVDAVTASVGNVWSRVLLFATACSLSFLALGLYGSSRTTAFGVALRVVIALLATVVVVATVFYFMPSIEIGRDVLAIATLLSAAVVLGLRALALPLMHLEGMKKRILVYGHSARMAAFSRMRRRSDRAGYNLVGVVHHSSEPVGKINLLGEPIFEAPNGLRALCEELNIDELVVALQDRRQALPVKELLECRLAGIGVIEFISFMERETGRIQLDLLSPGWMIFGEGFRRDGLRLFTARALDFVASAVVLLATSPIMLLAALAIWLEDGRKGGGVFYRQARVGFEGRVFGLTKFRSMRMNAEAGGAQWATKNDPRVTRVGALMRKTRIDELPQLLSVMRGHMGFVGPRPERPEFVAELEQKIPYYAYRHAVKPGLTGWAQISYPYGSSIEDAKQKLQYDLYYVKNHNLLFDLTILVQTVEVVLMGKGAR